MVRMKRMDGIIHQLLSSFICVILVIRGSDTLRGKIAVTRSKSKERIAIPVRNRIWVLTIGIVFYILISLVCNVTFLDHSRGRAWS